MTVLVGVLCQDGVVIGADSSMTHTLATGQTGTIEQPTDKIYRVGPDVLIAGTGVVGLVQRFRMS